MSTADGTLCVNGRAIAAETIAAELALFADAAQPEAAARRALAVRELLLQRAGVLGMLEGGAPREAVTFASREEEDRVIAMVLDREVATPAPTEVECRRHYETHAARFTTGELLEARHILFAVTPRTPVMAVRQRAEATLAELRGAPELFAERARSLSNCPSGGEGGSLGQFGRGTMVPEFDRTVFGTTATGVLPELVTSRYGFHVVEVVRRIPGRQLPFERVQERIAAALRARVEAHALTQYLQMLARGASISGVDLSAAQSPLLQ